MPEISHDDWLEDALKQPEDYIENQGFSRNVLNALPPKRTGISRIGIKAAAVIAGVSSTILLLPPLDVVTGFQAILANPYSVIGITLGFAGVVALSSVWLALDDL